jgi:hypothetical protein
MVQSASHDSLAYTRGTGEPEELTGLACSPRGCGAASGAEEVAVAQARVEPSLPPREAH